MCFIEAVNCINHERIFHKLYDRGGVVSLFVFRVSMGDLPQQLNERNTG